MLGLMRQLPPLILAAVILSGCTAAAWQDIGEAINEGMEAGIAQAECQDRVERETERQLQACAAYSRNARRACMQSAMDAYHAALHDCAQ